MTAKDVAEFIQSCILQAEAEAYDQLKDVEPDVVTPDDWLRPSDNVLWFRYRNEEFSVKVSKMRRSTSKQDANT